MRTLTDDLGRTVTLDESPQRLVSLCPSITETLFALDLGESVVGVTRYCLHPADEVQHKADVGGTKRLRLEDIHALQPDLIIAEKEENKPEDVEALSVDYPVYVCDVVDYASALKMISDLGLLCNRQAAAESMRSAIDARFQALPRLQPAPRAAYLIWRKPTMGVAQDTYIDDILNRCGLDNVFREHASGSRYPELSDEELQAADLDILLLSTEPFPFKQKHVEEFKRLLPDTTVRLVDGEAFSWYGVRMNYAADYLTDLITEQEEHRQ